MPGAAVGHFLEAAPRNSRGGSASLLSLLLLPIQTGQEVSAVSVRSGTGPLHQQQRGVIAQAAGLMVEHGLDQAP